MKKQINICKIQDIPENKGLHFEIEGFDIAVFKIKGDIFVINNLCPHQHAPILYEGSLNNYVLTCPLHGWSFDLKTGLNINGQGKVKKFNHIISEDNLLIEINTDSL